MADNPIGYLNVWDPTKKKYVPFPVLIGPQGPGGTITEVTAEVDDSSDNPAVTVTLGGTPEARTLHLAFTGLKGTQGDPGIPGSPGEKGDPGATTYAGLTDRPFYEDYPTLSDGAFLEAPDTLGWDWGQTAQYYPFNSITTEVSGDWSLQTLYYRVATGAITADDLANGGVVVMRTIALDGTVTDEEIAFTFDDLTASLDGYVLDKLRFQEVDYYKASNPDSVFATRTRFETGIYFLCQESTYTPDGTIKYVFPLRVTINGYTFPVELKQLEEKFIPAMSALKLISPSGTVYALTVADDGTLTTTAVEEG